MYRAFITQLAVAGTHSVYDPQNTAKITFATKEEARKTVEKYLSTYATSFQNGYRAFIVDWDTMLVEGWGEKPAPPAVAWHGVSG